MAGIDRNKMPLPTEPRPFNFPDFDSFQLDNGLTVLFAGHSRLPLISCNLCLTHSALHDPPGFEGLANLTSELLPEGTATRDSNQMAEGFEYLGAHYSTHTDWNAMLANVNVLSQHIEPAMDLFSDMIKHPAFEDHELQRIRKELITERLRVVDSPARLASEYFARILYAGMRYAMPVDGTKKSLEAMNREAVQTHFEEHYGPDNATLILVGDVDQPRARHLAETWFGDWRGNTAEDIALPPMQNTQQCNVHIVDKPGAVQSELRIGHLGAERLIPEYYAITLLNEIFGGYFMSRLNLNLREKHGFTYGVHSTFRYRRARGPFYVGTAVQAEHTAEAINEVIREMKRIREEPVSEAELQSAAGHLIGVFPIAFETASQLAQGLANITVFRLPDDYYRTFRDQIAAVTREDILAAAGKFLSPDQLQIVIVGDAALIAPSLRETFEHVYVHDSKDFVSGS